ncbi:ATP synthase F0 subunit B [bacterium]|nr:MAG: ATP synthase F0 subunit B [bacterium]
MSKTFERPAKQPSAVPGIVAGLVLVVVGTFVYGIGANQESSLGHLQHSLTEMGIPIDFGKTIATIGVLLVLFPVVRSFFVQPLQDAIQERNSNLERTFTEAEQLREDMTKLRTDYETRLVATEAQARNEIQSQIKEAQALRQTLMSEAAERADALVEQAQTQIAQERDNAILQIRTEVVDLALAAAEKVIGENMNDERNRRLVQDFVNRVEVAA